VFEILKGFGISLDGTMLLHIGMVQIEY
jgi:hypothetical protein